MKRILSICSVVAVLAMLAGCPAAGIGTAVPPLKVGASYVVMGNGNQVARGELTRIGPGAWVLFDERDWVNLDQVERVRCELDCD